MGRLDWELFLNGMEMTHSAGINAVSARQRQIKSQPMSKLLVGRGVKQIDFAAP